MPIVVHLMDNLVKEYGPKRGERVYYALEMSRRGPFAPGRKYAKVAPPSARST